MPNANAMSRVGVRTAASGDTMIWGFCGTKAMMVSTWDTLSVIPEYLGCRPGPRNMPSYSDSYRRTLDNALSRACDQLHMLCSIPLLRSRVLPHEYIPLCTLGYCIVRVA